MAEKRTTYKLQDVGGIGEVKIGNWKREKRKVNLSFFL